MRNLIYMTLFALCTMSCANSGEKSVGPQSGPILAFENADGTPALAFIFSEGEWKWVEPTPVAASGLDSRPNAFWGEFIGDFRGFRGAIGVLRLSASTGGSLWFNTSLVGGGFDTSTGANSEFNTGTLAEVDFDPTVGLGLGRACNLGAICDVALSECYSDGDCGANDISACKNGVYEGEIPDRFVSNVCLVADFYECTRGGGEDSFRRCAGYLGYYDVDLDEDLDPPGRPF